VLLANAAKISYDIVRLDTNNTAYLLLNNVAKHVPDDVTVTNLNYEPDKLRIVSLSTLNEYKLGPAIDSIRKNDGTPDDITRMEWQRCIGVMGRLIYDASYIGEYMNPAVVKWRQRLLLVTGSNYGRANSKTTKNAFLEFRWFNHTFQSFTDDSKYLGITTGEVEMLDKEAYGEDPRVVVVSEDRFFVFYAYPFQALTRIGLLEVAINPTTQAAEIVSLHQNIHPTVDFNLRHKNWAPFLSRDNDVLLIQGVNPFLVVKPTLHDDGLMHADVVSTDEMRQIYWPYGTIRGGSNAVYLPEQDVYLAFFHSKTQFTGNYMSSYVGGAYTFTSHAPYRLLSVSAMPIMSEQFYTGPWSPLKNARIDYCFFPTAIYVEGGEIVMSAGFQDHSGYLMKMKLQVVLDTLVKVQ
jgi:predicted GH43/DUF377 family glycosyl hydrolase